MENNSIQLSGIIESGSNENGYWTKLPDGTMIQYGKFTINFSNQSMINGEVNLPLPFAGYAVAVINNTATGVENYLLVWGSHIDYENYPQKLIYTVATKSGSAITVNNRGCNWIAIGKWK